MFTSRAEFRLNLRIDNADLRLRPWGRRVGLISDSVWSEFEQRRRRIEELERFLRDHRPDPKSSSGEKLYAKFGDSIVGRPSAAELLKRPEAKLDDVRPLLAEFLPALMAEQRQADPAGWELKTVETNIKYEGYLVQQQRHVDQLKKAERQEIPFDFDFAALSGLSREMKEKLSKIRPATLAHASRIPGVTPAAVSLIHVQLELRKRERRAAALVGGRTASNPLAE
jgi:tRNA uridine 5-carboxymethylaminomethyl modification enzyme